MRGPDGKGRQVLGTSRLVLVVSLLFSWSVLLRTPRPVLLGNSP